MQRRTFVTAFAASALAPAMALAQRTRSPKIGILVLTAADAQSYGNELREGFRELGIADARNYTYEIRSADGDASKLPELAADLVRANVDMIAAIFTPCAQDAK